MKDYWERILLYARDNPVKFVAIGSFATLGALPIIGFLAYSAATIVASIVGAVVIELFLLALGITGLAFVLFFITCISVCATSVFAAAYYTYRAVSSTIFKNNDFRFRTPAWPFTPTTSPEDTPEQSGTQEDESDKKK